MTQPEPGHRFRTFEGSGFLAREEKEEGEREEGEEKGG
jgi:hypothetical protein